jgi:hypothetical protein
MSVDVDTLLNNAYQEYLKKAGLSDAHSHPHLQSFFSAGVQEGYRLRVPQLEQLLSRIRQLEELCYVPGLFRCAKCQFQLNKIAMHVRSGAMTADNTPDNCPNCGSPLWRVTERDAGNDMCDRASQLQFRLNDALNELNQLKDVRQMACDAFAHALVSLLPQTYEEVVRERDQLKGVWEAASDLLMAHKNEGFAAENGGVEALRAGLQVRIDAYERGVTIVEVEQHATLIANPVIIQLENEVNDATRITYEKLDAMIAHEYYFTAADAVANQEGRGETAVTIHPSLSLLTFCVLVMKSGATITGESACADPENFDAAKGRAAARGRAITKAFELEGYKLATERKSEGA